jgi:CheY-like chemotaxis protein
MRHLGRLLVVDDSAVVRELLSVVFAPHCSGITTAESATKAIRTLREDPGFDLVLCDVHTPEGDGFDVLEYVATLEAKKPGVVLVTARPRPEDGQRAAELGALGYLGKPVSLRSLLAVLRQAGHDWDPLRPGRRRSNGVARVVDPKTRIGDREGVPQMVWEIDNLSATGAFLETPGPLPLDTQLSLVLELEDAEVSVRARVVRVQDPGWYQPGGVGVRFEALAPDAREALDHYLSQGELY